MILGNLTLVAIASTSISVYSVTHVKEETITQTGNASNIISTFISIKMFFEKVSSGQMYILFLLKEKKCLFDLQGSQSLKTNQLPCFVSENQLIKHAHFINFYSITNLSGIQNIF